MSTFSGINLSSRALTAAQRGMEVTGQNIANVNTEGYTRQRVEQAESLAGAPASWARRGVAGDGVEITGITRVADELASATARPDGATAAEHEAATEVWTRLETSLGESDPSSALSGQLSEMHKAWTDLGNTSNPENIAAMGSNVLGTARNVAATARSVDTQVQTQWAELGARIDLQLSDVNATARQIAGYNEQILKSAASGTSPNELLDRRDKAVAHLAELTGARAVKADGGMVDVYVGNAAVVAGYKSFDLTAAHGTSLAAVKAGTSSTVLTVGTAVVQPTSGSLKATLDGVNTTVPTTSAAIDSAVQKIADRVNALYNPTQAAGGDFFTFTTASVNGGGAAERIQVNASITATSLGTAGSTPGTIDGARALAIGRLPESAGSPTLTWRSTVVDVAAKTQASEIRADLAAQVSLRSTAARDSVAGVNIDEEMTSLVSYQHAYAAAARVLTTIDQALDTLINRTGLVGR